MTASERRDEIATGLQLVRSKVDAAAAGVDRDPAEITVIVVTKTFPVRDIRLLADLGVRDVAENRHPEAGDKAAELADLDLVWHFVGQVQSNKAARIASYADVVQSVDSARLARRLGAGALGCGRTVACLVQMSLDPPDVPGGRGGVAADEVCAVADAVAETAGLRLAGLMGVAPQGEGVADSFARLAQMAELVRRDHPTASMLSAGMSGDFELAVRAGATHVRVGSAILGRRPLLG